MVFLGITFFFLFSRQNANFSFWTKKHKTKSTRKDTRRERKKKKEKKKKTTASSCLLEREQRERRKDEWGREMCGV